MGKEGSDGVLDALIDNQQDGAIPAFFRLSWTGVSCMETTFFLHMVFEIYFLMKTSRYLNDIEAINVVQIYILDMVHSKMKFGKA